MEEVERGGSKGKTTMPPKRYTQYLSFLSCIESWEVPCHYFFPLSSTFYAAPARWSLMCPDVDKNNKPRVGSARFNSIHFVCFKCCHCHGVLDAPNEDCIESAGYPQRIYQRLVFKMKSLKGSLIFSITASKNTFRGWNFFKLIFLQFMNNY